MKAIVTLIFVIFIGTAAQANSINEEINLVASGDTIEMTIVSESATEEVVIEKNTKVARLYRRSNSRVKKALSFTTKRNRAKMA